MFTSLPNLMTMARIVMIPLIIVLLYVPFAWAAWSALAIYTLAAITDFLDGYYARKMDIVSDFGKFLDPIADKILVVSLLVVLAGIDRLDGIWIVPAVAIMIREFLVSGLREYLGPKNVTVPVTKLAKWKTAVQMVALGFLIMGDFGNPVLPNTLLIGHIGITIASIMTVITGWSYLKVGFSHMKN